MQANLCLRTAGPNAVNKHLHPLPFCQASSVLLRRHCQLALNFSPLSCNGLWAGPSRRLTNMAVHSHVTHQEDGFDKNKAEEPRRAISKLAAAAVVLACTLGAMCTSLNSRACTFPFFSPPQVTGEAPTSTPTQARPRAPMQEYTIQEKSIQALREIFDRKCNTDSQKPAPTPKILLEILNNALPGDDPRKSELKKYLDQLDNIEKSEAATNSLFKEWEKRQEKRQYNEAYNMGLVLIDLLINQGDYNRAQRVCQEIIKIYDMKSDVRLQIRSAILGMLLLADAMASQVKETEKGRMLKRKTESTMLEFIKIIQRGLGPPQS